MIELTNRKQREALLPFYPHTQDTLLLSGLQGHLGRAFLSDDGRAALVVVGGFVFLGGAVDTAFLQAVIAKLPTGFLTFAGSREWLSAASDAGATLSMTRYAMETPVSFDRERLEQLALAPKGFSIRPADEALYRQCLSLPWCMDVVGAYSSYSAFEEHGFAVFALAGEKIVAGCGVYAHADGQLEIEIDTHPDHRRKGLATACAARFLLCCLHRKITPHWDAMTPISRSLAQKLGFAAAHPYSVVCREGD